MVSFIELVKEVNRLRHSLRLNFLSIYGVQKSGKSLLLQQLFGFDTSTISLLRFFVSHKTQLSR